MDPGARHMATQTTVTTIQNPQVGNGTKANIIIILFGIVGSKVILMAPIFTMVIGILPMEIQIIIIIIIIMVLKILP